MLARRMFALLECAVMPAWDLRKDWEGFLRQHAALHGPNSRLAALGYGWLGGTIGDESAFLRPVRSAPASTP